MSGRYIDMIIQAMTKEAALWRQLGIDCYLLKSHIWVRSEAGTVVATLSSLQVVLSGSGDNGV
jgi:hypothetical protein